MMNLEISGKSKVKKMEDNSVIKKEMSIPGKDAAISFTITNKEALPEMVKERRVCES